MTSGEPLETLPPEAHLALAWSPRVVRGPLTTALQFDRRLARIVAATNEPMLGQMRLAWWREMLGKPVAERPRGDAVLDALGTDWSGREAALIAMVDAWEILVTSDRLARSEIEAFGEGRGAFFGNLHAESGSAGADRAVAAGFRWAIADAATRVTDPNERGLMIERGLARRSADRKMHKALRGLAVLEALALRALRRGGLPLMEGRGASLIALRAAIFLT